MAFCKNCGNVVDETMNFCNSCGSPVEKEVSVEPKQTPVVQQPVNQYEQPVYNNPYNVQPAPKSTGTPAKPLAIVGMVLGIEGLVWNLIMLLYSFIFGALGTNVAYYSYSSEAASAFVALFVIMFFAIFGLVQAIVGLVLTNKARARGNLSGMTKAGKGLNITSLIIACVAVFFCFIFMVACFS